MLRATNIFQRFPKAFSTQIPDLRFPLENIEAENFKAKSFDKNRKIGKLDNGINIASCDTFGAQTTVGIAIKAGLRYEDQMIPGISHIIEKLAFQKTEQFTSRDEIQLHLEENNAVFDCQTARDFIIYASSGSRCNLNVFLNVLKETTLRPIITEENLDMAKKAIRNEHVAMSFTPPPDNILSDLTHITAFGGKNLGNPKFCPVHNLDQVQIGHVYDYFSKIYHPENFYIIGVGIDHETMLQSCKDIFSPWNPIYKPSEKVPFTKANYVGGVHQEIRDLKEYHSPMPEFGHVSLSFGGDGTSNEADYVTLSLLTSFLGGGGSFSSGGPGKGMYSRLYTNFLNQHHWVNSAQAVNAIYSDVSLFSLNASSFPQDLGILTSSLIVELQNLLHNGMHQGELMRAKKQLISLLLMNLEMKPVVFEDFARQMINNGLSKEPHYWVDLINKTTEEQVIDYLKRLMMSKPTLVGFGQCSDFITVDELQECVDAAVKNKLIKSFIPNFIKKYF